MREILFRGKRIDNGEWTYGFLAVLRDSSKNRKSVRIYSGYAETDCGEFYPDYYEVDPETVGEYIGLQDKDGNKLFEGDVVEFVSWNEFFSTNGETMEAFRRKMPIVFYNGAFCTKEDFPYGISSNYWDVRGDGGHSLSGDMVIIGNIFDDPDILKNEPTV